MYKKIFIITCLCLCLLSSLSFASNSNKELSIYLGNTISLESYFNQQELEIPLTKETNIQTPDPNILTVDDNYIINTHAVGESIIIFTHNDIFYPLRINVISPIKEISTAEKKLTLLAGEIYPIHYEMILQEDFKGTVEQELVWTNSKNNIVGIKGNHLIYTYGAGSTILTGTSKDGSASISIDVTVIGNPEQLVIKPDIVSSTVNVGEKRQLKAFFSTKDITEHVKWESQFPELLSIDDKGLVTPLKAGTCEITATSSLDRKKDRYTFFIKSMVDNITLDHSAVTLNKAGETIQLNAQLTYVDSNTPPLMDGYYFTSSNPSVASVDRTGLVTAINSGITLISAISNDSAKKDFCTIEVTGEAQPTSINYTLVRDIHLMPYTEPILIGQKILLDYSISPVDATDQSVSFYVKNGSSNQIHFIDGHYYYIPTEKGNTKIKVAAKNALGDVEDEINVSVISPIASLNLSLALERNYNDGKKLYIGEQIELLTEIRTQGHYSAFDVYPNTLKYSVDDPDILRLDYLNGKYYVTALKRGSTSIRVSNIEDKHNNHLKIKVLNPVTKLSTNKEVKVPIGIDYTPVLDYTPSTSAKTETGFDINQGLSLEVEDFYLKETYIDDEIAYEKAIIEQYKLLLATPTITSSIKRHETRLGRLIKLKNASTNGYCLVTNSFLKNRNFQSYRYYTIDGNRIIGHYPSKAKLIISIKNTAVKTASQIYWQRNPEEAMLKKPSMISLENTNLPTTLFSNLDMRVSKQEMAYVAMYLDQIYLSGSLPNTNSIIYYDVLNEEVKQAIAKGYLQPNSLEYFGVSDPVDYSTFKAIINKIIPDNNLPDDSTELLTHQELLQFLNQVQ